MKYLRYVALVALLGYAACVRAGRSRGQNWRGSRSRIGGYVAGPPVCSYGYYPDYPYACAPYGYYGPSFFVNGAFIGAGPWYHGWGHPYYGRPYARGFVGRGPVVGHGFESRGSFAGDRGGFHGGGFRGRR